MKLLILGGTQFLGRHIVSQAIAKNHDVTLFNRGLSDPKLFTEVEHIQGDRNNDLSILNGRAWDAVIDTCGYFPEQTAASSNLLKDKVGQYVFFSSMSVYKNPRKDDDENGLTYSLEDGHPIDDTPSTYGLRKKLCEDEITSRMKNRALVIRPGLIVGPHDQTWRFPYWIDRIRRGGEVLAPGNPNSPIRFIDVTDLAEWTLQLIEKNESGVFNAIGPNPRYTIGQLLEDCKRELKSDCEFTWVSEYFLLSHNVKPWIEIPIWLPVESEELHLLVYEKAQKAGLISSPVSETIRKTSIWLDGFKPRPDGKYGMDLNKEKYLLEQWQHSQLEN